MSDAPTTGPPGSWTPPEELREAMMRYLDGELAPAERRRFEEDLERSTELRRELAILRSLQEDLSRMTFRTGGGGRPPSVWSTVNRRLTRPVGWFFLVAGALAWLAHVAWVYTTSPAPTWEKIAASAMVIGVLLLLATVIHDRVRELPTDPYRDVER